MDDGTADREWRCPDCGTLLGIVRNGLLEVKYKDALYTVRGTVWTSCRRCGTPSAAHSTPAAEAQAPAGP